MTTGQKISKLRSRFNLSQEELAEKLSVSRQSVSKWEMDIALPQIEKVISLCDLFGVTCDELLRSRKTLTPTKTTKNNKYFGTDGFRGEANVVLTPLHAYKIGRFLGWFYSSSLSCCERDGYRPRIVIGKDTRRSSYMLEYSIAAGAAASGADVYMLHVTTTPSVSYAAREDGFDCGIMITASHNPFFDNGIKIINRYGEKLSDKVTAYIENYLDGNMSALGLPDGDLPFAKRDRIGSINDFASGRNRYLGYLISLASHSYKHLRIGLDAANGAAWAIAKSVFGALGAETYLIGASPDGLNINSGCGSTHIEALCRAVKERHLDIGFAFDGDSDRCIAVDEGGKIVDGDAILYILAKRLKDRGNLSGDCVVATTMSNSGLSKSLDALGISCISTEVGDRFVYECMQENDFSLGGEQSGHIIVKKYATTGDGLLTAILLTEEICDRKLPLSKLTEGLLIYPQATKNIKVSDKAAVLSDSEVKKAVSKADSVIAGNGRVLLRASGTEPVVRVMVESESEKLCAELTDMIANVIKERGF